MRPGLRGRRQHGAEQDVMWPFLSRVTMAHPLALNSAYQTTSSRFPAFKKVSGAYQQISADQQASAS